MTPGAPGPPCRRSPLLAGIVGVQLLTVVHEEVSGKALYRDRQAA
jgi:hypothetical protein